MNKLATLLFFLSISNISFAQKRPKIDPSLKEIYTISGTPYSDDILYIPKDSSSRKTTWGRTQESDYNTKSPVRATETWLNFEWSKQMKVTYTLVYINDNGRETKLWEMNRIGKSLYIDSTMANRFFDQSDTIIVGTKVFIVAPEKKEVNLFGW